MNIAVFCGSHMGRNPHFEEAARTLGGLLASNGHTLVYGGSSWGYMGVVAKAAYDAGGRVVAVIPSLFEQSVIDSQPVHELHVVRNMAERKHLLAELADAYIALPGGVGTIDEATEMLTNNQLQLSGGMSETRKDASHVAYLNPPTDCKLIGFVNTDGYYDHFLLQLKHMVDEGLFAPRHYKAVVAAPSPEALLDIICK